MERESMYTDLVRETFVSKEGMKLDIELKDADAISESEKEELMELSIKMFPEYADLYRVNKYFSAIEPQKSWIVRHEGKIVATGKFLTKKAVVDGEELQMSGFGLLVDTEYQKLGIASRLLDLNIKVASEIGSDFIYATTENVVVDAMLRGREFALLDTKVKYHMPDTDEQKNESKRVYVHELKSGVLDRLQTANELNIGVGAV